MTFYDRNPESKSCSLAYIEAPHVATERVDYRCPMDKIAIVEVLYASTMRWSVAGTPSAVNAYWCFRAATLPGRDPVLTSDIIVIAEYLANDVGSKVVATLGSPLMMFPDDWIFGKTADASTGGSVLHRLLYKITELDRFVLDTGQERVAIDLPVRVGVWGKGL